MRVPLGAAGVFTVQPATLFFSLTRLRGARWKIQHRACVHSQSTTTDYAVDLLHTISIFESQRRRGAVSRIWKAFSLPSFPYLFDLCRYFWSYSVCGARYMGRSYFLSIPFFSDSGWPRSMRTVIFSQIWGCWLLLLHYFRGPFDPSAAVAPLTSPKSSLTSARDLFLYFFPIMGERSPNRGGNTLGPIVKSGLWRKVGINSLRVEAEVGGSGFTKMGTLAFPPGSLLWTRGDAEAEELVGLSECSLWLRYR